MKKILEVTEYLKNEYDDLNKNNFSGAIDVIAVRSEDGRTLKSTPFYVRFGKIHVLKPKDQFVFIEVNNRKIDDVLMQLDENGEAFFVTDSLSEKEKEAMNDTSNNDEKIDDKSKPVEKEKSKSCSSRIIHQSKSMPLFGQVKYSSKEENISISHIDDKTPKIENESDQKPPKRKGSIKELKIPSNTILSKLNLNNGVNNVKYTLINNQQDGVTQSVVNGFIYLWNFDEKIVISDIDGTITKSAFRGQILSMIGRDWFHDDIVDLFSSIDKNGYKIVYLSARPFVQCDITRSILKSIKQNDRFMPQGPLIVNPVGFFRAFQSELILRTPDEFKISFLNEVKKLFDKNPFFAGFGDKITDVKTYSSVGIKSSLMFIINEAGHVNFNPSLKDQLSYKLLLKNIEYFFPPNLLVV